MAREKIFVCAVPTVPEARRLRERVRRVSYTLPKDNQKPELPQYDVVQMAVPPSVASPAVPQIPAPQLPLEAPAMTGTFGQQPAPGTYAPKETSPLLHVVGAEAIDAHGVPTSAWHWVLYIIALGFSIAGLIASIGAYRM